jgi:predicted nucleic acid-binding protein
MYTVDASVWVNGFDQREAGHATSRQLLEVLRTRALPIIVPNLVLAEVAGPSVGPAMTRCARRRSRRPWDGCPM